MIPDNLDDWPRRVTSRTGRKTDVTHDVWAHSLYTHCGQLWAYAAEPLRLAAGWRVAAPDAGITCKRCGGAATGD